MSNSAVITSAQATLNNNVLTVNKDSNITVGVNNILIEKLENSIYLNLILTGPITAQGNTYTITADNFMTFIKSI